MSRIARFPCKLKPDPRFGKRLRVESFAQEAANAEKYHKITLIENHSQQKQGEARKLSCGVGRIPRFLDFNQTCA